MDQNTNCRIHPFDVYLSYLQGQSLVFGSGEAKSLSGDNVIFPILILSLKLTFRF